MFVWWRPVAEPAAAAEAKAVVKAEDETDVAAQRFRDRAAEEEGQYATHTFRLLTFVCSVTLQFTVVMIPCSVVPSHLFILQLITCSFLHIHLVAVHVFILTTLLDFVWLLLYLV